MFVYEKKLQYPVKIKTPNPALSKLIVSQYGGPDCKTRSAFSSNGKIVGNDSIPLSSKNTRRRPERLSPGGVLFILSVFRS